MAASTTVVRDFYPSIYEPRSGTATALQGTLLVLLTLAYSSTQRWASCAGPLSDTVPWSALPWRRTGGTFSTVYSSSAISDGRDMIEVASPFSAPAACNLYNDPVAGYALIEELDARRRGSAAPARRAPGERRCRILFAGGARFLASLGKFGQYALRLHATARHQLRYWGICRHRATIRPAPRSL